MAAARRRWRRRHFFHDNYPAEPEEWTNLVEDDAGPLLGSLTEGGRHLPVFDLDVPARLIPSKTRGHAHLYIDREISWFRFRVVLWALAWAGLVDRDWARLARLDRNATVRAYGPPSVRPADGPPAGGAW